MGSLASFFIYGSKKFNLFVLWCWNSCWKLVGCITHSFDLVLYVRSPSSLWLELDHTFIWFGILQRISSSWIMVRKNILVLHSGGLCILQLKEAWAPFRMIYHFGFLWFNYRWYYRNWCLLQCVVCFKGFRCKDTNSWTWPDTGGADWVESVWLAGAGPTTEPINFGCECCLNHLFRLCPDAISSRMLPFTTTNPIWTIWLMQWQRFLELLAPSRVWLLAKGRGL